MQRRLISFLFIISLFTSCGDNSFDLELSQTNFELDNYLSVVTVEITTLEDWTTINESDWCTLDKTSGTGNATIEITVAENDTGEDRTADIYIKSGINYERIYISQYSEYDDYQFEIPIIFHILYKNALDNTQYVTASWISEIMDDANELFASSTDMNVTFVLATEDESGNTLTEAGIDRIKIDDSEIDYEDFMYGDYQTGIDNLWSLTSYVNVFVYLFEQTSSSGTVLGVTHLPYTISEYALEGLTIGDYYSDKSYTTDYPHCVSLNNKYIYSRSDDNTYVSTDIVVTLAHELGHYVGLFHPFEEEGCSTDYCDDTPNYIRSDYTSWVSDLLTSGSSYTFAELCLRTSTDGSTFTARNIMDYYYCYSDEYTDDQRSRVRHVLNYSPLMPGPKRTTKTKSANAVKPEPRFVECPVPGCDHDHNHVE
ncbi:MAG: zinc-dependent metalloproteinase lipoprotein [Rikenellaceae bacterium]